MLKARMIAGIPWHSSVFRCVLGFRYLINLNDGRKTPCYVGLSHSGASNIVGPIADPVPVSYAPQSSRSSLPERQHDTEDSGELVEGN